MFSEYNFPSKGEPAIIDSPSGLKSYEFVFFVRSALNLLSRILLHVIAIRNEVPTIPSLFRILREIDRETRLTEIQRRTPEVTNARASRGAVVVANNAARIFATVKN